MKNRGKKWVWVAVITAIFAVTALCACVNRPVETLTFKLPQGFSGPIIVLADSVNGQKPIFKEGAAQLDVPIDGVVRLHSLDGFETGYNEQFVTASGTKLEYNNPSRLKGIVEIHSLGRSATVESDPSPDRIVFFVGTFDDFSRYKDQLDQSGLPLPTGSSSS